MTERAKPTSGWGIKIFYRNAPGSFFSQKIYALRSDAIASYNECFGDDSAYERGRRRGEVLAVCVTLFETD